MRSSESQLTYFVGGMDCASCGAKVEKMVGRLPGSSQAATSFTQQTLRLRLDETQTPRESLEANLKALGYAPALLADTEAGQTAAPTTAEQGGRWFESTQGRLVLRSGALLALAWLLSFVAPSAAHWGFIGATLLGVWPLARKAWAGLRLGDPFSINMLVTLAAVGATAIGEAAEGAVVVFFFAVGELLEGVAAGRARAGIRTLTALAPRTALLLTPAGVQEVEAITLRPGQTVQVGPGVRIPADGTILTGASALDDSPVTGESVPVPKSVGDSVYAGSINTSGLLTVRVDKAAHDNTIARIIHMVEQAEANKAPTARFIDRFSRWYTPGVVAAALLTALIPLLLGQPWQPWLYKGVALLLIGCPCALVLSVPAAITSGLSAGARQGLLVKGGAALERLGSVRTVAFDKTGTLTTGSPSVTEVIPLGTRAAQSELGGLSGSRNRADVLRLAAAAEAGNTHPLAQAIAAQAHAEGLSVPLATQAEALAGQGVRAEVEGRTVMVVSPRFAARQVELGREQQQVTERLESQGHTVVAVLDAGQLAGFIALRDEPRAEAQAALGQLRRLGLVPVMLTGDNARTAQAIGEALGLEAKAELLPEDKLRLIGELPGPVAMVGDGINDAPALARADVGIAMGSGTDVALETADAALLRQGVGGVADLIQLSRATMRNIRQNIAFALGLKLLFLVTTLLGHTNLWMAVLADTGATALVTANALRLLRWRPRHA